ncbi:MAG: tRNA (adenosine(37)-N6)-threonylcarbamoyltransferase complex transferase subunit TsaD [Gammaproteobacteria bacterium]|nr:MAG: tRNA (adenosine(37)-N6)-threonylcarbamoyltransferase complex transferase subunit TsaD [Gammaproteobacteria bacterium]
MIVLGIESSCDETGIALFDTEKGELAHHVYSQIDLHRQYGGVVPELASRDHINRAIVLIDAAIREAGIDKSDIGTIAYTAGPGLLGALLCGASIAQSLAFSLGIPSIRIHHMEGHLLAALLDKTAPPPEFPFIALLVSGGHTMLVLVKAIGDYHLLGTTLDDAVGEAFDKTAKLMGLPYPGGPELAKLADSGNPEAFALPRPMTNRPGLDFSFSGLKTQVRLLIEDETNDNQADIAASFQAAVIDTLLIKCRRAIKATGAGSLVIAGGVGANKALRQQLARFCQKQKVSLHIPPLSLCTDNGLMIAHAGALRIGQAERHYAIDCRARWPLEDLQVIAQPS